MGVLKVNVLRVGLQGTSREVVLPAPHHHGAYPSGAAGVTKFNAILGGLKRIKFCNSDNFSRSFLNSLPICAASLLVQKRIRFQLDLLDRLQKVERCGRSVPADLRMKMKTKSVRASSVD